jgi:hypothetical protein
VIGGDHIPAGNVPLVSIVAAEELAEPGDRWVVHQQHYDCNPPENSAGISPNTSGAFDKNHGRSGQSDGTTDC